MEISRNCIITTIITEMYSVIVASIVASHVLISRYLDGKIAPHRFERTQQTECRKFRNVLQKKQSRSSQRVNWMKKKSNNKKMTYMLLCIIWITDASHFVGTSVPTFHESVCAAADPTSSPIVVSFVLPFLKIYFLLHSSTQPRTVSAAP